MARPTTRLIAKSGWRPCPRCGGTVEYGANCRGCQAEAKRLIESAMSAASRALWKRLAADDTAAMVITELSIRERYGARA